MSFIKYINADGDEDGIKRDDHHYDVENVITAYDIKNNQVARKIQIPLERVVMVHE